LGAIVLAVVSAVLVAFAPQILRLFVDSLFFAGPALAGERDSMIVFARLCLPQVFFYGMFVLIGQILNSRGRFGPMMWAPIANNAISIVVLVLYLFWFGALPAADRCTPYTYAQELVLGGGATLGIAAPVMILL